MQIPRGLYLSSFFKYNKTLFYISVNKVLMKRIKKYKSVNVDEFDQLLKRHFSNDSSFSSAIGQTQGAISMKRQRNFSLSFQQAFSFYARYYMSDSDLDFVIDQMKQDGFEVQFDDKS